VKAQPLYSTTSSNCSCSGAVHHRVGVQPIGCRLSLSHTGLWTLWPNSHTQPRSAV